MFCLYYYYIFEYYIILYTAQKYGSASFNLVEVLREYRKQTQPFWIDFHCLTRCKMLDGMQPILLDSVHHANWPISYKSSFSCFQARLHSVKIDEETQTPEPSEKKEVSLNLRQHPVASTFGIFDE